MTYTIKYPNKLQFTTIPKLGKQMNAGKIPKMAGSINFTENLDASQKSKALEFRFANKAATPSEMDNKPLSTVNKGGLFQVARLKAGSKNSYNKSEIMYWYNVKFKKTLSDKMRREDMVAEFEQQLKLKK